MVVTHELWTVVLSVLVAIQSAYVGLMLALELPDSAGGGRTVLLAGSAVTLAVAIWSMHSVGMLAWYAPVRTDDLPTLIALLACVVVVWFAVYPAPSAPASRPVLTISAVVRGDGHRDRAARIDLQRSKPWRGVQVRSLAYRSAHAAA